MQVSEHETQLWASISGFSEQMCGTEIPLVRTIQVHVKIWRDSQRALSTLSKTWEHLCEDDIEFLVRQSPGAYSNQDDSLLMSLFFSERSVNRELQRTEHWQNTKDALLFFDQEVGKTGSISFLLTSWRQCFDKWNAIRVEHREVGDIKSSTTELVRLSSFLPLTIIAVRLLPWTPDKGVIKTILFVFTLSFPE